MAKQQSPGEEMRALTKLMTREVPAQPLPPEGQTRWFRLRRTALLSSVTWSTLQMSYTKINPNGRHKTTSREKIKRKKKTTNLVSSPKPCEHSSELIYCYNTFLQLELIAAFVKTFIKATREAQQAAPMASAAPIALALGPSGAAPTVPWCHAHRLVTWSLQWSQNNLAL